MNPAKVDRPTKKIAVTVEREENTSPLSEVYCRSNFFLIYNFNDKSSSFLRNPFASELGGAGIQAARFLIENNVDSVLVKKIGTNPLRFLRSAKIKVYICAEETAEKAIQLFDEGKILLIENINENISYRRRRNRYGRNISNKKHIDNKKGKL